MRTRAMLAGAVVVLLTVTGGCRPGAQEAEPGAVVPTPVTAAAPTAASETETAPTEAPPTPTASPEDEEDVAPSRIVFYSDRDGSAEIYTMNADGSDPRRLTSNRFSDTSPVWSPDGSRIAFISNRNDPDANTCFPDCYEQLYVIDAGGGNEDRLLETDFSTLHPDWHPDGTKLSFDTEFNLKGNVYVFDVDGSELRLLIEDGFWADWSPDGSQIAFASARDGNVEIYVANADGTGQKRLTQNTRLDYFPAWSPDGRSIAFSTLEEQQIYVIDANGGDERQLTHRGLNEDPAWSPDGAWIAFQSARDGNFEIYRLRVEDALGEAVVEQRLTHGSGDDYWPDWTTADATAPALSQTPESVP